MRRFILPLLLLAAAHARADLADSLRLAYYAYDRSLPLNAELKELEEKDPRIADIRSRYLLHFDSVHDQRVPAILSVPKKEGPFPAILLLAGSGGHKDTDYVRLGAQLLNTLGFATLSIDAQYHGDRARKARTGDFHFIDSNTNRDAWIQTVIDLRRAIDYLESRPDIRKDRIGYLGFSQGGMVGGTLLGVEARIAAAVLAIPGGGFVEWAKQAGRIQPESAATLETNAQIVDPVHFIGRFAGRPLFIAAAKRDELIPKSATEALFNAAGQPKELKWYDSGHALNPLQFIPDLRAFFLKHLASSPTR